MTDERFAIRGRCHSERSEESRSSR
jgi:hypothetical protein